MDGLYFAGDTVDNESWIPNAFLNRRLWDANPTPYPFFDIDTRLKLRSTVSAALA